MTLEEILMCDNIEESLNYNLDDILDFVPELLFSLNFDQKHPHHHKTVWGHTVLALSKSSKDFEVRLSLLFHDIGKPFSYQEGEVRHFDGHASASALITEKVLTRLGYPEEFINRIVYLVRYHDTRISKLMYENNPELILKLYKIQNCDALAHHPEHLEKRKLYLEKTKKLFI